MDPGVVYGRASMQDPEQRIQVLHANAQLQLAARPEILPPGGVSEARQEYLHHHIRPLVRPAFQDITCPAPDTEE